MDQKNHQQCQHGGNGSGGFFVGLLVGVVLTLLLTTKKGRRMFKELTDEGMTKFSDFEKKLQDTLEKDVVEEVDEFDDEEENEYVAPQERRPAPPLPEPAREVRHIAHAPKPASVRREYIERADRELERERKAVPGVRREVREFVEERERREPEHKAAVVHKSSGVRKFFRTKK